MGAASAAGRLGILRCGRLTRSKNATGMSPASETQQKALRAHAMGAVG